MGAGCLRPRWYEFVIKNTAFGLFVGFELAICLAWVFESGIAFAPQLLTASAALVGTVLAVSGVLHNISNQNELAEKNRLRSLAAANATLPLALISISDIAERAARICVSDGTASKSAAAIVSELELPSEILESLQKAIEYASEENAQVLRDFIGRYQVLRSDTKKWLQEDWAPLLMHLGLAVDWAVLARRIDDAFPYARGETNNIRYNEEPLDLERFFLDRWRLNPQTVGQLQDAIAIAESRVG